MRPDVEAAPPAVVTLAGPEHTVRGEVTTLSLADGGALAMSVGKFPKPYISVDPNEDAALLARGNGRVVVAVIDGHLGYTAASATLAAIQDQVALLLASPQATMPSTLQTVLAVAEEHIAASLAEAHSDMASSRTAVTVAVVDGNTVFVATVGDTVAALVARRVKKFRGQSRYLGPNHGPVTVQRKRWKAGDVLLLASDGFTDYAGLRAAPAVMAGASSSEAAAHDLVLAALDGGAGDNVTVAVVDLSTFR